MMWGRTEVSWGVGGGGLFGNDLPQWGIWMRNATCTKYHLQDTCTQRWNLGWCTEGASPLHSAPLMTPFPHPWDACPILVSPFLSSQQPLNASPANSSAGRNCWYTWCCRDRTGTHPGHISNRQDLIRSRGWICGWGLEKLWFPNWIPYFSGEAMMPGFLLQT